MLRCLKFTVELGVDNKSVCGQGLWGQGRLHEAGRHEFQGFGR